MMAALPDKAPATPAKPRKVLVLGKAQGFVHSSIPLAAKTVEALGTKTKAWATTITYDPADINAENLKQYDARLPREHDRDIPRRSQRRRGDLRAAEGAARLRAQREGPRRNPRGERLVPRQPGPERRPGSRRRRAAAGRGGTGGLIAALMLSTGDKDNDQKLSKAEFSDLADSWFDKMDPDKTGKVAQADFTTRLTAALTPQQGRGAAAPRRPQVNDPLWPEFNKMIGGYFKFHWNDPQHITVKIDDPKSPLTAMFHGQEFEINDETYTFAQDSFSRDNVHVLTSIDYAKMSDEDKAKEPPATARTDHDYALSWIRREGQGRVFYEAHGHNEKIYAIKPMLEHLVAGIQYALGDLKADDTPSSKLKPAGSK